jgi:glycosyltransferase involved in cell wall biosynthesis
MKQKIVILSAFATPFRSGAEACAEEVGVRLMEHYDVTLVTARLRKDLPVRGTLPNGLPVLRVGFGRSIDKWFYPLLAPAAVQKLKPALVHAVLETFAGLALFITGMQMQKTPRVLTLQTTNRSFLKKIVLDTPDAITAISSALLKIAAGLGRKKVTLIPNGISLKEINEARKGVKKEEGRVLFVGRLERMKGVDTLLKAFAHVVGGQDGDGETRASRVCTTGAHLRIVGDGSQRKALEALAAELGISDCVTFVGYLKAPEVYREYAAAEIFAGLSRSEALGNVFLEAQAAGCAVLATNVGGIPDSVKDGETGLLVAPDDVEVAAHVLGRLLSEPDLQERLAKAGEKHAQAYDWDEITKRYIAVYEGLLETR